MSHGRCPHCARRFRSEAARQAAERYKAIHDALRMETSLDKSPDRQQTHMGQSAHFKQTGDHV